MMNMTQRASKYRVYSTGAIAALLLGGAGLHAHDFRLIPDVFRVAAGTEVSASVRDSAAVASVVHRFHEALAAGDSLAVLDLLLPYATILEAGGVETVQEYRTGHLPGDMAFARAVRREAGPVQVVVRGDVAWTTSVSTMRGTYRDRAVNSQSVELMVLERTPEGWRIAAIHWSSRQLRT